MSNITVIGAGYVGLVTAACFAEMGNSVACVDIDEAKVGFLRRGIVDLYEPQLEPLVQRNMQSGRLSFTTDIRDTDPSPDFVFVCVGTPLNGDRIDLTYVYTAFTSLAGFLAASAARVVIKSTVPPGTSKEMAALLSRMRNAKGVQPVVSNPEFLREGRAVHDFQNPNRIIIGATDACAAEAVADLYRQVNAPLIMTDPSTAELIKLASNAFLATKISFINQVAALCESVGADVTELAQGMGFDHRIGRDFLDAGVGYGGSCLPKDTQAMTELMVAHGLQPWLLQHVMRINGEQPLRLVDKLEHALGGLAGRRIAVLGLAFKPNTDDIRCAPAISLINELQFRGAEVRGCDPVAWNRAAYAFRGQVQCLHDPYVAAQGCDAVVLATEWPQFLGMDLHRLAQEMSRPILVDGRNSIDPEKAQEAGFTYIGVGRSRLPAPAKNQAAITERGELVHVESSK
ncbi:MAG: UDP-glucose/GDP-mannose dehydrogenase family protein [Chloroflexi bacterium]|nr:UDP-glucose/GDP-mannose dehydrogenase family protein [Chloroflexota bacterium]